MATASAAETTATETKGGIHAIASGGSDNIVGTKSDDAGHGFAAGSSRGNDFVFCRDDIRRLPIVGIS